MEIPDLPEGAEPIYDVNGTSGIHEVIEGLQEQVFKMAKEAGNAPKNFTEDVQAFAAAVDWTERWIQGLLVFQVLIWVVTVGTRRRFYWQSGTFFFVCALVSLSETLNTYAHMNWKSFSRQDYFDPHGFSALQPSPTSMDKIG